jgi:hypothetical protein
LSLAGDESIDSVLKGDVKSIDMAGTVKQFFLNFGFSSYSY